MKSNIRKATVCGKTFTVYSDFIARGTFATDEVTSETKCIRSSGYLSNELSVRKAIAIAFHLDSFRK